MALDLFDTTYMLSRWRSASVTCFSVPVSQLRRALPDFELRPFGEPPHDNPYMRAIVRMPTDRDRFERPVAAVSDRYELLQHRVVATWLQHNLVEAGFGDPNAHVTITRFGERLRISVPLIERSVDTGRSAMPDLYRPEIELTNSMDRSAALAVKLRWRRVICLNGMFTSEEDRLRSVHHVDTSRTDAIHEFVAERLASRPIVLEELSRWRKLEVRKSDVQAWVEGWLREKSGWTVETCARMWAILETGYDGVVQPPRERGKHNPLAAYRVGQHRKVPGISFPVQTAYDVVQILTWITSNQRSVEMQVEGTESVPRLMRALLSTPTRPSVEI
jgi:hypothetical protein